MKKITTPRRLEYSNRFMEVHHTHTDFGAFAKDYYVIELGPRAGLVAVRDGRVLLTKQYRFLTDGYSWELPGGRVDDGETPEEAAIRECIEETGIRCLQLAPLITYYPGLDNFNNRTSLFFSGQTEVVAEFVPNEAEAVEIGWISLETCLDMVFRGEIMDAMTVSGLLAYETRRLRA